MKRTTTPGLETLVPITADDTRSIEIIDISSAEAEGAFLSESDLSQLPSGGEDWSKETRCEAAGRVESNFEFLPEHDLGVGPLPSAHRTDGVEQQAAALEVPPYSVRADEPSELTAEAMAVAGATPRVIAHPRESNSAQSRVVTRAQLWRVPNAAAAKMGVGAIALLVAALLYSVAPWSRFEPVRDDGPGQAATEPARTRGSADAGGAQRASSQASAAPEGASSPAASTSAAVAPRSPLTPSQAGQVARLATGELGVVQRAADGDGNRQARPSNALPAPDTGATQVDSRVASGIADTLQTGDEGSDASFLPRAAALATAVPIMVGPAVPAVVAESVPLVEPSTTPPAPPANSTAPVRALLAAYERAYERLDARSVREIWPAVDERALARAFAGLESQTVRLDSCSVTVGAVRGMASCSGTATYVTRIGNRSSLTEAREWTFVVAKTADRWVIETVQTR